MPVSISVIIPTLNEEQSLASAVDSVRSQSGHHAADVEIIVSDGGSQDQTLALADQLGCRTVRAARGRALQMNAGAQLAAGDVLLFLHADCRLPDDFALLIEQALQQPHTGFGAFAHRIDSPRRPFRLIESFDNLRARWLQRPYGDQPLFVRRELFEQSGGFPEVELLEDLLILKRLRRRARYAMIPACAITSARRWEKLGLFRTTMVNWLVILGYTCHIPIPTLANFYRGQKSRLGDGRLPDANAMTQP